MKKRLRPYQYKLGTLVRISHTKRPFEREYHEKWMTEIFRIKQRSRREGLPIYKIEDYMGEALEGTFYEPELQPVFVDDENFWRIDKVLKTRGSGDKEEHLVKWFGWPKKYNQWIPAGHLV